MPFPRRSPISSLHGWKSSLLAMTAALGLMASSAQAGSAVDPCQCGPMDVVFVVDVTGSMGTSLSAFKSAFPSIVSQISTSSNGDFQLGLVTFNDSVAVLDDLSASSTSSVQSHVAGLTASGGANAPEASNEALNTAVNNLSSVGRSQTGSLLGTWRTGARKYVVLITDALPGGFDDTYTAGVDDVLAHSVAASAYAKSIAIDAIYVANGAGSTAIQAVMQDYSTTSRGIYRQVQNTGTDVPQAVLDILSSCRKPADVYIKDHPSDLGYEPHGYNPIYASPDIKVCTSPTSCAAPGNNPVYNTTNYLFVTLRNSGPNVSPGPAGGDLQIYYTASGGSAVWMSNWTLIGVEHDLFLTPGQVREVRIPWTNVPTPGHYCLLARWASSNDPMTYPETIGSLTLNNTRYNNNLAWHNVDVVRTTTGHTSTGGFVFHPEAAGAPVGIAIKPLDKAFPGTLVVDLGDSFASWKANGSKGTGFKQVGTTALSFTGDGGTLSGLLAPDNTPLEGALKLTFDATKAPAGAYSLQINQLSKDNTTDLGGVQYQVSVLSPSAPPMATVLTPVRAQGTVELHWPHSIENTTYQVWRGPSADFKTTEGELLGKLDASKADETTAQVFRDAPPTGKVYFYRVESLNAYGSALSDSVPAADTSGN